MTAAIRCVLFDFDGVLADYDRDVRIGHLAHFLGRPSHAVRAAIYASGVEDAADAGLLDADAYLEALGRELDCTVPADAWVDARRAATHEKPPMLSLASELRARGITVAMLSNNGLLMAQSWPAIVPALFPLFSGRAFCSAQLGATKPSPATYLRCLEALAMPPPATLFVDDNPDNVAGAREAGLVGHCFAGITELQRALEEHGLA